MSTMIVELGVDCFCYSLISNDFLLVSFQYKEVWKIEANIRYNVCLIIIAGLDKRVTGGQIIADIGMSIKEEMNKN